MKRQFRIFLVVYTALLLLPQSGNVVTPSHAQQGSEIFLPERVELEKFLFANTGNDIFFQSNVDNGVLPHGFSSTESAYDLYAYDGMDFSSGGTLNPIVNSFMATNPDALYHASNNSGSDLPLDLEYTATYYDLSIGQDDSNGLSSMVLFEAEMSGFRFNASAGEPMIIDLKIKGQQDILKMDLFLVSPSGIPYAYSAFTDEFQTFVNQFIPIVPTEDGVHTLYLSPLNDDIILESLFIYTVGDDIITGISSGYRQRWTGLETQTVFFKFQGNITEELKLLELTSIEFFNDTIGSPDLLLGQLSMNYFTPTTNIFGGVMPASEAVIQWKQNTTYVAVTATPPNDEDQFIKGIKNELGLSPGFDVEYAFWAEEFEVEEFDENVDILIEDVEQPNDNKYLWTTSEDLLIGINSTAAEAVITNLDDLSMVYNLDSNANDILNVADHVPTILPAGNYLVELKDSLPANEARIHTLEMLSLTLGDDANYALTLDNPLFFMLPVTGPIKEHFNFTYLGFGVANASISVDVTFFDSGFNALTPSSNYVFDEYHTNPTTRFSDNNTVFGNTALDQAYNVQLGYLRVNMEGNQYRDPSDGSPLGPADNSTLQATFNIERLNYLDVWQLADPLNLFESRNLNQVAGNIESLNETKDQIIYVYDFTSGTSFNGYGMSFSSTNMTYQVLTFVDWTNNWHNINVNTATMIDGVSHYNHYLEFGTNMETSFAIVVIFENSPTLNGTFTIDFDLILVQETPGVTLGSINTIVYNPPYEIPQNATESDSSDDESFLEENATVIIISTVAVAGAGAGTVVYMRRRGG